MTTFAFRVDVGQHALEFLEHAFHGTLQVTARLGRHHFARIAIEQPYVEFGFKIRNQTAYRRLGQVQALRGAAEMLQSGNSQEST